MLGTLLLTWFCKTSACCLHNFVTKLYMYGILKATCNSRIDVCLGNLPIVRSTWICSRCNFKRYLSDANSQEGQACVITDRMSDLWRVDLTFSLNRWLLNKDFIPVTNLMHSIMFIIRRSNCVYTAYGIVTLYEWSWWSYSTCVLHDHHDHS